MIIENKVTGEIIDTGDSPPRLRKMAKRIYSFSEALEKLELIQPFGLKMVTLTYRPDEQWAKNHIRDYLRALKRNIKDDLLAYAWVAELQKRGAVHYHMYCAVNPGTVIPRPDDSGMWQFGMSRVETGRSVFYIATYTSKEYQKTGKFPKGLRMYAVWIRGGLLSEYDLWQFKLSAYPTWLSDEIKKKEDFYCPHLPTRREGGGWKILHPASSKHHQIWIPFFTPFDIVRFTTPGSGARNFGGEDEN